MNALDVVGGLANVGASPYIIGGVITVVLYWNSVNRQLAGDKYACLYIGVPCGLATVSGLLKAMVVPEARGNALVGAVISGVATAVSTTPLMLPEDKAHSPDTIYSTTTIGTGLGLLGCAVIQPNGAVAVANPLVAPAVVVGAVQPDVQVVNPLRR